MTRNSQTIARNFNAATGEIGRAINPKSQSLWVCIAWSIPNSQSNHEISCKAQYVAMIFHGIAG